VNCYTDWQEMVVKKCTARTVLSILNQAAQQFIVTLEKLTMGLEGARAPCGSAHLFRDF